MFHRGKQFLKRSQQRRQSLSKLVYIFSLNVANILVALFYLVLPAKANFACQLPCGDSLNKRLFTIHHNGCIQIAMQEKYTQST